MGLFSSNKTAFNWTELETATQLNELLENTTEKPVLFFKHSTRCSISSFALRNFEREWNVNQDVTCVFLDLIKHRDLSNLLAEKLHVVHQSPQVILVHDNKVIHHSSHQDIDAETISSYI